MDISFLSPGGWTLRLPGLKEGKKTPREGLSYPTPDSDLSNYDEFGGNLASLSRKHCCPRITPIDANKKHVGCRSIRVNSRGFAGNLGRKNLYGLFNTICGAGLLTATCALTF